jgi:hypothetical protein
MSVGRTTGKGYPQSRRDWAWAEAPACLQPAGARGSYTDCELY